MDDRDDEGDELMAYVDIGGDEDLIAPLWKVVAWSLILLTIPFLMAGTAGWAWEARHTHPWAFVRGMAMLASMAFGLGSIIGMVLWCAIPAFLLDGCELVTKPEAKARMANSRFDQSQEDWEEEEDNPSNLPRRRGMGPL